MALAETKSRAWWSAKPEHVWEQVIPYVSSVENLQAETFDKFLKLESTYDTNPRTNRYASATTMAARLGRTKAVLTENLIALNVDTVAAHLSDDDIRVRIETDGADWSHQQTAKRLEKYIEGLSKLFDVGEKCRIAFKTGAALKGTGVIKVWIDAFDRIQVAPIPIDNIIVDEVECRDGHPKQLHYRDFFDKEDLKAQFPEHADAIEKAQGSGNWRLWAGYRPMQRHEVVVIESWRLPIGPKGHKNYVPGRHTLVIDGHDLLDEEYDKPHYPFAVMQWNKPSFGFYGISLAERILPFQNLLNRRHYQINRSLDRKADPITYVHQGDQNIMAKSVPQIGAVVPFKVQVPVTVDHQAVGQETYNSIDAIRLAAARQAQVTDAMAHGQVPTGIESGVGVREARQTHTLPFSIQESAFEKLWLQVDWLILDACRDLGGTKAPEIIKVSKYGNRRIKWSEVDMDDLKIEMMAASTLADTPAGRRQRVTELAQAGVITTDEARELYDHPDIEAKISMYTAASEKIQWAIEEIENGNYGLVPSPFDNLERTVRMFQAEIERIEVIPGVPEELIEALSDYAAIAANMLNPPAPPQPAGMPGMSPGTMPPGPVPAGAPPPAGGPPPAAMLQGGPAGPAQAFAQGAYAPMVAG